MKSKAVSQNDEHGTQILENAKPASTIFNEGLWRKSRHPNLFFE